MFILDVKQQQQQQFMGIECDWILSVIDWFQSKMLEILLAILFILKIERLSKFFIIRLWTPTFSDVIKMLETGARVSERQVRFDIVNF